MYLQEANMLPAQFIKIQYDCSGGFDRCGQEWSLKLKDAQKNFSQNNGKHICRLCQLRTKNPMKSEAVQEKIKKTNLEKYGVTCTLNKPEHIETRKKMFEVQEYVDARTEKTKKTNLERYGVDHFMKTEEGLERQKNAFQEKYGVDRPLQAQECKDKMKQTCQERYGVDNPAQLPEVRAAMVKTSLERHGVEYYNQLPEMKDYLRENCTQWLAESYANPWAKGITRPEEWNAKQRETVAKRIFEGKWAGGFQSNCRGRFAAKKCRKNMPRFLSSLELKMHFFFDTHPNVEWYDYEPLAIPYKKQDGSSHLYFPDFLVKYANDVIEHIFETKTWKEKDSINVQLKQLAGIEYADQHNMTYTILFDEDVDLHKIDLEEIKKLPGVILEKKPAN